MRERHSGSRRGERPYEAVARAASIAAVAARDAANDGEAEAAVEGLEELLALGFRDAGAGVAHTELDFAPGFSQSYLYGGRTVPPRVLEQVADHPAQQARVALDADRLAFELGMLVARAFLGGEGQEIHGFGSFGLASVEAAREEDFVDEGIELGDVLLELALAHGVGALLHELDRHADAGKRRAQLMRGVRQQRLVRSD